jgi:hypothetical protein
MWNGSAAATDPGWNTVNVRAAFLLYGHFCYCQVNWNAGAVRGSDIARRVPLGLAQNGGGCGSAAMADR